MCPCNSEKGYVCTVCRAAIVRSIKTMSRAALNRLYGHWKCTIVLENM
jgi:hypothetical protein